jgi:hypothetical protein
MRFEEMQPEDLIKPLWLDSYKKQTEAIWWQLVQLNSNVFVLEKLAEFPFDLFVYPPSPMWQLAYDALFETSVMIVWRVGVDKDAKVLTIPKLVSQVKDNLRQGTYRYELEDALHAMKFDEAIAKLERPIMLLRQNRLAHFNTKWNLEPSPDQINQSRLQLSHLKEAAHTLNSLFNFVCFGHEYALLPDPYSPDVYHAPDADARSDVEKLLDLVARNSVLLNVPERQPDLWPHWRGGLSREELGVLNKYRAKFGLPKA